GRAVSSPPRCQVPARGPRPPGCCSAPLYRRQSQPPKSRSDSAFGPRPPRGCRQDPANEPPPDRGRGGWRFDGGLSRPGRLFYHLVIDEKKRHGADAMSREYAHYDQVRKPQSYHLAEQDGTEAFDDDYRIRTCDIGGFLQGGAAGRRAF